MTMIDEATAGHMAQGERERDKARESGRMRERERDVRERLKETDWRIVCVRPDNIWAEINVCICECVCVYV